MSSSIHTFLFEVSLEKCIDIIFMPDNCDNCPNLSVLFGDTEPFREFVRT